MTPGKKGPGKGATGTAAKKAGGIFGKSAGELFRFKKHPNGKVIGLDPKKIDPKKRKEWTDHRKSKAHPKGEPVKSRKVDPNDPSLSAKDREMMDAVENARKEAGDKSGNNYAAVRFIDKDGQERILVTHSDGVHSERVGGNYLLDQGIKPEDIKGVYTERSPCDFNSSYCDQWMKRHLPADLDVTHRFDYGINGTSKSQANSAHRAYRNGLF